MQLTQKTTITETAQLRDRNNFFLICKRNQET